MSAWSTLAETYHAFVGSERDLLRTQLLYPLLWAQLGDLHEKKLLDIGCGNGYFAHQAAAQGAQVTAFDNAEMIKVATQYFSHPQIQYSALDGTQALPYPNASYDHITANLVLMDIEHIDSLLREAARVIKPNGTIWITILHPCFTPPVGKFRRGWKGRLNRKHAYFHLNNYFDAPQKSLKHTFGRDQAATEYFHRTISDYTEAFAKHQLAVVKINEPKPNAAFVQEHSQFFHATKISIFLVFQLRILR